MKKAVVCGGLGFIGSHLVERLKNEGYFVRVVDIKDSFSLYADQTCNNGDLREMGVARGAVFGMDEVYQLAADFGGMGYIGPHEAEIVRNNALINLNVLHAAASAGAKRYFLSSSVCVYRDMEPGEPPLTEDQAYPALSDNEYGWEKLYAERCALTYSRHWPMKVRIARFANTYGPGSSWRDGREKAPAALCRKAALAPDGGEIEVWGDGAAVRNYTYVDDLVDGIFKLAQSDLEGPVNLGSEEPVTVRDLAEAVIAASGKDLRIKWVRGEVGVRYRAFSKDRAKSIGAVCKTRLRDGIIPTYRWIEEQVNERGMV